jgi:hypothetical protein
MDASELADLISQGVRRRRLERGGYTPAEIERPSVPFDQLPSDDRERWHDVAVVVLNLREENRL